MEIIFSKLYKVDISEQQPTERPDYQNIENFKKYIHGMLEQISTKSTDRFYKFRSDYTEVRTLINNILVNNEYDDSSKAIACRLLSKEREAQTDLDKKKLGKEILKGMLILSLVKMTDEARKLIIFKVDYDEFLSEMTGDIVTGLSIRKKVYKALICELNNSNEILNTAIYDTNTPVSIYWWKKFLELEVVITDEENTKTAFDAIEKDVLNPIRKKYKEDYLHLWNTTIAYFRSDGEFSIATYRDDVIGHYMPFDQNLDIAELKSKINKLPAKHKFDNRFNKTPSEIHKRFKNTLHLTNEIDLIIKHDIANIKKTIRPFEDVQGKYIMILSPEGFQYAQNQQENKPVDE
jgi:hypothetical protein